MNPTKRLWHKNYFRSVLSLPLLRESYSNLLTARFGDGLYLLCCGVILGNAKGSDQLPQFHLVGILQ